MMLKKRIEGEESGRVSAMKIIGGLETMTARNAVLDGEAWLEKKASLYEAARWCLLAADKYQYPDTCAERIMMAAKCLSSVHAFQKRSSATRREQRMEELREERR